MSELKGYLRPDGRVGIRNRLAVISTVVCSNVVAGKIATALDGERIAHDNGCLQLGEDRDLTVDSLTSIAKNPNVGAALLVGLGCEQQPPESLLDHLVGTKVKHLTIQGSGGTEKAVERGMQAGRDLLDEIQALNRQAVDWSDIVVAVKTGDVLASTLDAVDPVLGQVVDGLLDRGARVVVTDTLALMRSGEVIADRIREKEAADRWAAFRRRKQEALSLLGWDLDSILPERSTGASRRLGSHPIAGVLAYGQRPPDTGLWIMDTPHEDMFVSPGLMSAGVQVILHGSSRASLFSPPVIPVIKLCGDPMTMRWMPDVYDIDVSPAKVGSASSVKLAQEVLDYLQHVVNGTATRTEAWDGDELALPRIGATL